MKEMNNMSIDKKTLDTKIDFALFIEVSNANPNGDPLNGNRPRQTYDGFGEISDVCLKRKVRNRLIDLNQNVFVRSNEKKDNKVISLSERYKKFVQDKKNELKNTDIEKLVCEEWLDVRAFGQVFAFKGSNKKKKTEEDEDGNVSLGIRGPVTIQSAFSLEPITIVTTQITKSVNSEPGDGKSADTMGQKHRVSKASYVAFGSINPQLASLTGFDNSDSDIIKEALKTLFQNDESSARPSGTMEVSKLIWIKHNCPNGNYSSAEIHRKMMDEKSLLEIATLKEEKNLREYNIIKK